MAGFARDGSPRRLVSGLVPSERAPRAELIVCRLFLASVPHPFISILSVLKGKRLLPRAIRHLSAEQTLTLLTLLVATFDTLDVVIDAPLLDQLDTTGSLEAKQRRFAVEAKTEALLNAVVAPIMQVVGTSQLRMVTGMLGLLLDRNELSSVVRSKVRTSPRLCPLSRR